MPHTTDGTTVDYYTADVTNATDYYPFGMQMPGRNGHVAGSGSYTPTTNSTSIPDEDLTVNNRISDRPAVYEATNSITFIPDFISGVGDVFEARILVDPAAASSGGGAWHMRQLKV